MNVANHLPTVRYVMDETGQKTDVLVSFPAWQALVAAWEELIAKIEDQEDQAILLAWLERRSLGNAQATNLDAFEAELVADGLLPRTHQ